MHPKRIHFTRRRSARFLPVLSLLFLGACATPPPPSIGHELSVPRLLVATDCGECKVPEGVVAAILQGYSSSLARQGARVDEAKTARLIVRRYADRSTWWIIVAGPLALLREDAIDADLEVNGRIFAISDSARAPFRRIDTVASRLGEIAAEALARSP